MNDPGLDEPAQQAAEDVEKNVFKTDKKKSEAEEQKYLDPRQEFRYCTNAIVSDEIQSLVVRINSVSTDCWYFWSYCKRMSRYSFLPYTDKRLNIPPDVFPT